MYNNLQARASRNMIKIYRITSSQNRLYFPKMKAWSKPLTKLDLVWL